MRYSRICTGRIRKVEAVNSCPLQKEEVETQEWSEISKEHQDSKATCGGTGDMVNFGKR